MMGLFFVYLIKSFVCFVFFYALNVLVTGNGTLHKVNRWVWLSIICICLLLPLGFFAPWPNWSIVGHAFSDVVVISGRDSNSGMMKDWIYVYNIVKIIGCIYIVGAMLVLCRFGISYLNLIRLIKRAVPDDGAFENLLNECKWQLHFNKKVKLLLHNKQVVPFSWMNYVVVNVSDVQEHGREILSHELAHIQSGHSYDVMLVDSMLVLQWFNPVCWLIKRRLQQAHEYEADERVIDSGVNARDYQLLLIKKATGKKIYTMANGFNHSNLRNRIEMMLRKRQKRWICIKYLYILPLAFGLMMLYANPLVSAKLNIISFSFEKGKESTLNKDSSGEPLCIMNGQVIKDIKEIKPDSIASITIMKDAPSISIYEKQYGERAKNGVIVIKLK